LIWIVPWQLSLVTVGNWMAAAEYQEIIDSDKTIQNITGTTTHMAYLADVKAFDKQAKNGTLYVEFNIPKKFIIPTNQE
jgi:hypothetical protein